MPLGPGSHNALADVIMRALDADGVILVIVTRSETANGFVTNTAIKFNPKLSKHFPKMLRDAADEIERTLKSEVH